MRIYVSPKGFCRWKCKENLLENKGMRSIVENVNYVLKGTQIASLRSKKHFMRERELGWHLIFYNIKKIIRLTKLNEVQTFLFFQIKMYVFSDETLCPTTLKIIFSTIKYGRDRIF